MSRQKERLHYHHYCTGHGFQKEIDGGWETCDSCGDIASIYVFSFDSKEEFVEKCVLEHFADYRNDEGTLSDEELLGRVDKEELKFIRTNASDTYDLLIV